MRLFVAADLPGPAREAVAAAQQRIAATLGRAAGAMRWVKPEHSHLTLVFLGDVAEGQVPAIVGALGRDVDLPPFEISLESIGVFPPRGAPRVLWIGLGVGAAGLTSLQRTIGARLAALGIALEPREFHPHLTLARWRDSHPADRARALNAAPRGLFVASRISGATLYQSRLSPAGPTYTPLARANLTGEWPSPSQPPTSSDRSRSR